MGTLGVLMMWVTGVLACVSADTDFFFVVAPNMIRFEHSETIMISVFGRQRTVRTWLSHNGHKFSQNTSIVREDSPHQTNIMIREANLVLEELEKPPETIMLTAECDGVQRQKEILIKYNSGYIYVQTSQPIYKPRDRVKIRYLALTESMKKVGNRVNVTMDIINPENHIFMREHKSKTEAFHRYDFELPQNPDRSIGIWTVKVYFEGMYKTVAKAFFEVREYVVPTFGVDINVNTSTILPTSNTTISVTVTSKYVYGKPVEGRCDLKVYLTDNNGQTEILAKPMLKLNAQGMVEFEIDMPTLKRVLQEKNKWFPNGQRLKLQATTSEDATLNRESGIHAGIVFSEKPYIFKFTRSKKYFRYLRNFYLRIDVQRPNGEAAAGVEVKSWQVGQQEPCTKCQGETDEKGQITFIFPYSEENRMVFQADDILGLSTSEEFVVEAYIGGRNQIGAEYIIRDGEHQITADNNMQNTATGLTSMLLSRGEIIETEYERRNNEPVKILTPGLQEKLSPSGRYVVFYVDTVSNEVVADSIKVSVTPRCKGQDIHMTATQNILPGDSGNLQVTGQPGTHVGLSVLDKAMLLLNDKHILHKNKMFQELESHDMGCGYGGGKNSANVFNNAGLTVITNAVMATEETRGRVSCEGRRRRRKRAAECQVDQRCCEEGELFAMSLYEMEDVIEGRKVVDEIDCYSKVRQLLLDNKDLPWECLVAYYHSCVEYVHYENDEDGLGTKSGDSDFEIDLREINFNEKDVYVRKNFRESFEFSEYPLGERTGELTVNLKYPDSITEWMIQAIGITPNNGVCISEPLNVTAFQEFFIQLDLPYQAVRMEHINVKATVFMYGEGGANSTVSLYMDGVDDLCSNTRPGRKSKKVEFEMQPNSAHTVQYPVIPMAAPKKYPIKVTAIRKKLGKGETDAIQKDLYVTNEGAEKLIELSSCLDPMNQLQDCYHTNKVTVSYSGGENPTQIITVDLTLPEHIKGTGQGTAYIYSDNAMEDVVQAVLIGGVENWIRLPTGCVEQTIIRLAPLVYAFKYLKLTKQVTEKIEKDGNSYIRKGVLQEFQYKKASHYYPPYDRLDYLGLRDFGPSTWLTAFIAKVFCQAKKAVDDSVDESIHVAPTINWLATHQNPDGSFTEVNYVNHGPLMGLSKSGHPALTAFILIALQECRIRSTNVERAVKKAMAFLERQNINTLRGDPYALAIISYALAISNSTKKMTTYENLKAIAGRSGGMMYWGWPGTGAVQPPHIEATSYALLAQLQLDDLRSSNETVRWLSRHRSSGGAFKTTQDTVIGLQALSEYNIRTYRTDIDLRVKLMADDYPEKIFSVNKDTAMVQKIARNLPVEKATELRVEVTGKGTGNMRIDLRYNVEKTDVEKCPFDIEVNSNLIELDKTAINIGKLRGCDCGVCAETDEEQGAEAIDIAFGEIETLGVDTNFGRKKRDTQGGLPKPKRHCTTVEITSLIDTAGMVTVEIGLETGMTVQKEDLDLLVENEFISMYELPMTGKGFFVLYIDKMFKDDEYRFVFTLEDTTGEDVFNRQASYVKVTDYYNPDSKCQASYGTGSNLEPSYSAECKDDACKCLINTCPEPWKEKLKTMFDDKKRNPNKRGPADFLILRTCDRHYAEYAVLVKILGHGDGIVEKKYSDVSAEVVTVFNYGKESLRAGMTMHVLWRMDCKWPQFLKGKKYYIIARDGIPYTDDAGNKKFKYYIREGDIVLQWKPSNTPVGKFMIRGYERFWSKGKQCPK